VEAASPADTCTVKSMIVDSNGSRAAPAKQARPGRDGTAAPSRPPASRAREAHLPTLLAAIRAARVGLGWTQAELGRRIGSSASTVSLVEAGRRSLDLPMAHAIERALWDGGASVRLLRGGRGFVLRVVPGAPAAVCA